MTIEEAHLLLGVVSTDDALSIKRAWREQVRRWHPDHHPDDPSSPLRIQRINAAYDLLQRTREQIGPVPRSGDVDPYGRSTMGVYPSRGEDIETSVIVDVADALRGVELDVDVERWGTCSRCGGFDPVIVSRCERCHGFGREMLEESLRCSLPAGIRDDDRIRINGVGNAGLWGGDHGDVVLRVKVGGSSPWDEADGRLSLHGIPLSLEEAVLGGAIRVPTPHGWRTLKIEGPVDLERMYRIRGVGYRDPDGSTGDLWCSFTLSLPDLDDASREAFRGFVRASAPERPRFELESGWRSLMDRLADGT